MKTRELYHGQVFEMAEKMYDLTLRAIEFFNHDLPEEKKRNGGYITVINAYTGIVVMMLAVGEMDDIRRKKYFEYSVRKGLQLFMYLKTCRTSFECQHAGFPQGAVYASEYIFSFSGQESDVDEAIAYMLAVRFPNYQGMDDSRRGIAALTETVKNITQNEKCFQLDKGVPRISYEPFG